MPYKQTPVSSSFNLTIEYSNYYTLPSSSATFVLFLTLKLLL